MTARTYYNSIYRSGVCELGSMQRCFLAADLTGSSEYGSFTVLCCGVCRLKRAYDGNGVVRNYIDGGMAYYSRFVGVNQGICIDVMFSEVIGDAAQEYLISRAQSGEAVRILFFDGSGEVFTGSCEIISNGQDGDSGTAVFEIKIHKDRQAAVFISGADL